MSEEPKDKRALEKDNASSTADVKPKQKRRRRNYDDYDEAVAKEEKDSKANRKEKKSNGTSEGADDASDESEMDDAKLDALVGSDEEEEDLAEIDTSNIITAGRRTRGKIIDYKKTAEELESKNGTELQEETEEADDDFKE
ncbi:hypothetical protein HG535_0B02500 [Zygotorulaspora mrakii]|uniref:Histone H2A.Z-specific chaperone CHZ1 n=1 Tax=Zygotorulaspora mrakii TaxID=42260 RepID=A0A7H9AY31_ZYGMR|nr:uncharacterized protein HG535_0B02500 [Zygotorulaspora mrakii]QLG71211.1 hypothetical protein HG535_0B02500 [Zygotorulaspora mrakii]